MVTIYKSSAALKVYKDKGRSDTREKEREKETNYKEL